METIIFQAKKPVTKFTSLIIAFVFLLIMVFVIGWNLVLLLNFKHQPLPVWIKEKWRQLINPKRMMVLGFLPYWNFDKVKVDFDIVDQLLYFGLTVDENGQLIKFEGWNAEPGWVMYNSSELTQFMKTARQKKKKVLLTIISFDPQIMSSVVKEKTKMNTLIDEIIKAVKEKNFDGVDIDFEYFPPAEDLEFGPNFNYFLKELKKALIVNNTKAILSVDIYPKAFILGKPYDLKPMTEIVDQIILMAYDFTQSNSDVSGPVAPIKAASFKDYSITQALDAYFYKIGKPQKLILGIPLYGYQWRTYGSQPKSYTLPGLAQTVSYKQAKELIKEKELTINWDATASSPWLQYQDGWIFQQLYFENLDSLKLKFDLALKQKLKGVGFWALGYEEDELDFWQLLKKYK